jgi:hypothetical protein
MKSPASDFFPMKIESNSDTPTRLRKLIRVCEDTGIKVCVGEQSAEYVLFKKVYPSEGKRCCCLPLKSNTI